MKPRPMIERSVPLIDLQTDGRTVTAYAATFDEVYPVSDEHGQYDEVIARTAFNRALSHGISRVSVLYNHGLTLYGTPSEQFSKPLGSPVEIRAEKRGLLTVTRYNQTPLADEVLEMIRNGDIKAQSFRGAIVQTAPPAIKNGRQLVRRLELGLKEYGPSPFPANVSAEIVAVRSVLDRLTGKLNPEQIAGILEALGDDTLDVESLLSDIGAAAQARVNGTGYAPPADGTGVTPPATDEATQEPLAAEAPVDPGSSVEIIEAELAALRARHNS